MIPSRKFIFSCIALILVLTAHASSSFAVPASPDIGILAQPDGNKFKARNRGDEWLNWVETEAGFSVAKNKTDGFWYYVSSNPSLAAPSKIGAPRGMAFTKVKAHLSPPADTPKHLSPTPPTSGSSLGRRLCRNYKITHK